jgi:hypothetical protein
MATVKTAISLEDSLFKEVEALAKKMKVSRSRLFALALEEFLRRHQNQQLLEQLNAAYDDAPDPEEEPARAARPPAGAGVRGAGAAPQGAPARTRGSRPPAPHHRRAPAPSRAAPGAQGVGTCPRSVVNVSQILTVDKSQLGEQIGRLSAQRVRQILDGIRLVLEPRE